MSFEDKIDTFIGSLSSSRASEMADRVRETVNGVKEKSSPADEEREDIPAMILAEDTGPVGDQMEVGDYDFSIKAHQNRAQSERNQPAASDSLRDTGQPLPAANASGMSATGLPEASARSIMSKKLNYFQIERAAEIIKERLESEMKIEKERHGEEP